MTGEGLNDLRGILGVLVADLPPAPEERPRLWVDRSFAVTGAGTVVTGTMVLTVDGQDRKLPAGSYFALTGKKPHATRCEAGAECVLAIDARGKWDVVQKKTKKK